MKKHRAMTEKLRKRLISNTVSMITIERARSQLASYAVGISRDPAEAWSSWNGNGPLNFCAETGSHGIDIPLSPP